LILQGIEPIHHSGCLAPKSGTQVRLTYYAGGMFTPYHYSGDWPPVGINGNPEDWDEALPWFVPMVGSIYESSPLFGLWKDRSGYLGVRIQKEDGWHYGWIQIEDDPLTRTLGGYVIGYVYETRPNTLVETFSIPEPAVHGLILLSVGLCLRRKKTIIDQKIL